MKKIKWYNKKWTERYRIVIDGEKISKKLHNFSLMVKLDKYVKGETDIVFTSDDGITKLEHIIEDKIAWVIIPTLLPSVDSIIYVYSNKCKEESSLDIALNFVKDFNKASKR